MTMIMNDYDISFISWLIFWPWLAHNSADGSTVKFLIIFENMN